MSIMNSEEIMRLFMKHQALLKGHFLLSSGLHSDTYFQSALILQHPREAEKLGQQLREKITGSLKEKIDVVVSPALGGIVIGQEVARALGCRAVFAERVDGKLIFRRGFTLAKDERCLVVEDVITTGLSTREVMELVSGNDAKTIAVASLVDRSGGKVNFGVPQISLLTLSVTTYKPEECPLCAKGTELVKPGSRKKPIG